MRTYDERDFAGPRRLNDTEAEEQRRRDAERAARRKRSDERAKAFGAGLFLAVIAEAAILQALAIVVLVRRWRR